MRFSILSLLVVVLAPAVHAESPTAAKDKWSVDDVVYAESAHGFQVSPNGRWAAWVKTVADRDKGERISNLMRSDLVDGGDIDLTRGQVSCTSPKWSPDGQRIAFLTARPLPKTKGEDKAKDEDEPKTQLWLIDAFGGEAWHLTEHARGVEAFDWAGNDALVFVAKEEATYRENSLKDDKKDATVVVEDEKNEPPIRLFRVEVKSKKVTRLTDNRDWIEQLATSPDGKYAVTVHARSLRFTYDNQVKPVVLLHDLAAGTAQQLFADDKKLSVSGVRWAPDSRGFYFVSGFSNHPVYLEAHVAHLHYYGLAEKRRAVVDLGWERGLAGQEENEGQPGFVPIADGFLALLADGARNRAARFTRTNDGWKRDWLAGEHATQLFGLAASADGKTVLYARSSASAPPQWYRSRLVGDVLRGPIAFAEINEGWNKRPRGLAEVVRWKGALDEEVEGILYYPHGYQVGKKYPLVLMIHGGPFGADRDCWEESWAYAPSLYCQRGAFVLRPNYHGSSNYGLKFAESIADGKYYDLPLKDIESGVDELIRRGLVDPAKLGVLGWSNGAILTVALIAKSPRYKAAVAGAGGAEWVADWGACEFGDAFDRYYFGKSPLEDPQLYLKMAPLYDFHKVRTPVLLFQGDADRVVPAHHAWTQFRALQQSSKADVRLVMFPGEKHSLKKLSFRRRKLEEELAWFDKHLFNRKTDDNESLKSDSPLAKALKLKDAKRDADRYGVLENGVLVPETAPLGKVRVGRFEVTQAQFADFDKKYAVEPGTANYPASGITFEQARAYCTWLSDKTGRTFRLPNEDEAEELYEKSEPGENTLDHWAGYTVNPEDASRLREHAAKLAGRAPLLREVGCGRAGGPDEMFFDLGGNVAEWVQTTDGKGKPMGGSADAPADAKQRISLAAAEYRGLRVVEVGGK
jgi:dipeptidyl aminopeptidase/acylaminoacyl peptidase